MALEKRRRKSTKSKQGGRVKEVAGTKGEAWLAEEWTAGAPNITKSRKGIVI